MKIDNGIIDNYFNLSIQLSTITHKSVNYETEYLKEKSFAFAVRIVNLYKYLKKQHGEYIISQQIIRSGTSVGALIREAEHAESTKDFIHKLNIGLKEANESKYWLDLLAATEFLTTDMFDSLNRDCEELLKLLIASVKTSKLKLK